MACRGVHFALPLKLSMQLRAKWTQRAKMRFVCEVIEESMFPGEPEFVCETDKAWDGIHRCLTGGTMTTNPSPDGLHLVVLGGKLICRRRDYLISYLTADQVRQVEPALRAIAEEELRRRYDRIDPEDFIDKSDEDFEYTWHWFTQLQEFWGRAAEAGREVIFTVDQ